MGDYEKTLAFHPKALNIQENAKCNPLECPTTYMNLGETYCEMKDYTTALTYYQKRLNIRDEKLAKTHPDLAYGNEICSTSSGNWATKIIFNSSTSRRI
ncbi:unnamed protein product [Rotaria magnacalcarata]|uniref:Uncharacterized protein n=1 Tax=Rotaria magnacalcarata TaxID=392030 RepID=A0A816ZV38_9BILA|nr:unnamed protein product [Rotaria magnacalcarata]